MAIFNFRKAKKSAESPNATVLPVEQRSEPTTKKFVMRQVGSSSLSSGQIEEPAREEDREKILARMRKANEQKRHEFLHAALESVAEQNASVTSPSVQTSFDDILSNWRKTQSASDFAALPMSNLVDSSSDDEQPSAVESGCVAGAATTHSEKDFAMSHTSDSGYDSYAVSRASSEAGLWTRSSVSSLGSAARSELYSMHHEGHKRNSPSTMEDTDVEALSIDSSNMQQSEDEVEPTSSSDRAGFRPQSHSRTDSANMDASSRFVPSPLITRFSSSSLRPASHALTPPSPPPSRPLPSPPTHRLSVLQGYKVNKAGRVLDEEGEVIGELVLGDILDCVRQRIDNKGQVLDGHGKIVGMVAMVVSSMVVEQQQERRNVEDTEEKIDNVSPDSSARDSAMGSPILRRRMPKQPAPAPLSPSPYDMDREFEEPRDVPPPPRRALSRAASTASTTSAGPTFKHERSPSDLSTRSSLSGQSLGSRHHGNVSDSTIAPRSAPRSRSAVRERIPAPLDIRPSTSYDRDHIVSDFTTQFPAAPTSSVCKAVERERIAFVNSRSKTMSMLPPVARVMSPVPEDIVPSRPADNGANGGLFSYKGAIPTADGLPAMRSLASGPPSSMPTPRMAHNPAPSPFNNPKLLTASGQALKSPPIPAIPPRSAARPSSVQFYASLSSSNLHSTKRQSLISEENEVEVTDWAAQYPAPPIPMGGMMSVYGARSRPGSVRSNMTGKTNVTAGGTVRPRSYFTHRGKVTVDADGEEAAQVEHSGLKRDASVEKAEVVVEKEKKNVKGRLFGKKK